MRAFARMSLWDMLTLKAVAFYSGTSNIRRLQALRQKDRPQDTPLDTKDRGGIRKHAEALQDALTKLGTPGSLQILNWILADADDPKATYRKFSDRVDHLDKMVRSELSNTQLLALSPDETALFWPAGPPFGEAVLDAFPSAAPDIESAGKCLALGEPTAAVFHLMRAMEVVLRVLGRALDIPYAPSWESYLKQINANMAAKHTSKAPKWKKQEAYFRDVAGDLQIIKIAWRNPTMHVVRHYSAVEADEIYRAVRNFMQRAATRLKEPARR